MTRETAAMRTRGPRLRANITARMRTGSAWSDVRIMNLSSRGLMIIGPQLPSRGAYVEVRKGRQSIVARVVWSDRSRMGVHTQDRVPIQDLIEEIDRTAEPPPVDQVSSERRKTPRSNVHATDAADLRRSQARAFDFAVVLTLSACGAWLAFDAVRGALGTPLAVIDKALVGGLSRDRVR